MRRANGKNVVNIYTDPAWRYLSEFFAQQGWIRTDQCTKLESLTEFPA